MNQDAVPEALRAGFGVGFCCGSSFFLFVALVFLITTPWLKCYLSNANVPVWWILGMRLRGSPVGMLADTQIALVHSGFDVNIRQVECAYLANRHRILQPGDLFEIVKKGLQEKESPPAWLKSNPSHQFGEP
jgi:hypothetical protein